MRQLWGNVTPVTSRANQWREEAKFRALRLIEANPAITQRELAEKLGISLGSTHYMLRALAEKGLIKLRRFSRSQDKYAYVYVLTPKGVSERLMITREFLSRKRAEYAALCAEIEELGAELEASATHPHDR